MNDIIGNEETEETTETTEAKPDEIPGWLAGIEDDNLKNEPTLRRFKGDNAQALAVSYMDLRRKVGDNPIVKPKDDAAPEEWDNYYKQLGRPDTPADYQYSPMDGLEVDTEMQTKFSEFAHGIGLTGTQADKLNQYVGEIALAYQADEKKASEETKAETEKKLREEWGAQYENNVKLADKAMRFHGGEELKEALKSAGLLNNAVVIKFFQKIGLQTGEDTLKGIGDTPAEGVPYTRDQLEKMMQDPNYWNDKVLQKKVQDGFKKLYPGQHMAAPTERGEGRASVTG